MVLRTKLDSSSSMVHTRTQDRGIRLDSPADMDIDRCYRHKLEYNRIYRADRAADTLRHNNDNLRLQRLGIWDSRDLGQVGDIYKMSLNNCSPRNHWDTLDHRDMNLYSEMCFDNRCRFGDWEQNGTSEIFNFLRIRLLIDSSLIWHNHYARQSSGYGMILCYNEQQKL